MCLNSTLQSQQIEKCVQNGMPQKIVKTVKSTLRKRAEEHKKFNATESGIDILLNETIYDYNTIEDEEIILPEPATAQSAAISRCPWNSKLIANKKTPTTTYNDINNLYPATNKSELKIPKLCGRFTQQQKQQRMHHHQQGINIKSANNEGFYVDMLAVFTQLTKQYSERLTMAVEKLQHTKIYTLLTKTTQPAHVIAVCILSFVLITVWPNLFGYDKSSANLAASSISSQTTATIENNNNSNNNKNPLATIAYLGAFATHFGAQIWMTFVSGLSLYFSLPRHIFGQCQQILFPKYFTLNSILTTSMLILHIKYFLSMSWTLAEWVQLVALTTTAVIEITVRLYLAPPMLLLMHEKYKIESAIGSGQEVGTSLVQSDLVQCPHYQRIHKAFRRAHMTVAIGNMTTMLATFLHLYFLAAKIQIS